MGRFFRPLAATLVLASAALIGQPEASQAVEPPPPLPASASQAGTRVVNLPPARPAASATTAAPAVPANPSQAPATATMTSTREILLELGKRQISLVDNGRVVGSWPVAVGDPSTPTPTGRFKVRNKVVNPQYQSTKSGKNNPTIGPQGPLGDRWIGFHTTERDQFGIHGTPTAWEWTVKSRSAVSHGCVRMLTPHVRQLFDQVDVGTPVVVKP
ncbi:MAG: L,D-transpeptidase [Cyanobacteriota bacterium]|jgi:lipoprotein-anchoring transpeptidase ErfK/SrfK